MSEQTGLYIGAILTAMSFTYLYKDNPLYRIAEYLFVALSTGYGVAYVYHSQIIGYIEKDMLKGGEWSLLIPIAIGLLIYTRYNKKWVWISRIPMAFWIGYGAGYGLAYDPAVFMKQVFDSFINITDAFPNNLIYAAVVVSTVVFFLFTVKKDRGALKYTSLFGRYALMVAFGSAFGSIAMAYLSLIIGRLQYVLVDCLHILK